MQKGQVCQIRHHPQLSGRGMNVLQRQRLVRILAQRDFQSLLGGMGRQERHRHGITGWRAFHNLRW